MRRNTKFALAAAAAVPAAFVLVTQYPRALTKPEHTADHSIVLADIPGIADANPRLSELMWLGSHDCLSNQIGYCSPMDPRMRVEGHIFAQPLVRALTRGVAVRYSKAQNIGMAQQLRAGARVLDLRLTWYNGDYYTRHSIISGRFKPQLRELLRYLNNPAHAGEIVMLYVWEAHFDAGQGSYAHLFRWLAGVREGGKNLFDFVAERPDEKLISLRYNDVTRHGTRAGAVLLLHSEARQCDIDHGCYYVIEDNVISPWANSIRDSDMRAFYAAQEREARAYAQSGAKDKLFIMQAQKTLSLRGLGDFAWVLKGVSLLDLARSSNARLVTEGVLERWCSGDVQVLFVDNINSQKEQFNSAVNQKIRDFNERVIARN